MCRVFTYLNSQEVKKMRIKNEQNVKLSGKNLVFSKSNKTGELKSQYMYG